jgi:hypothetical protein
MKPGSELSIEFEQLATDRSDLLDIQGMLRYEPPCPAPQPNFRQSRNCFEFSKGILDAHVARLTPARRQELL